VAKLKAEGSKLKVKKIRRLRRLTQIKSKNKKNKLKAEGSKLKAKSYFMAFSLQL
jgi:hypothetical protein